MGEGRVNSGKGGQKGAVKKSFEQGLERVRTAFVLGFTIHEAFSISVISLTLRGVPGCRLGTPNFEG